MIQKIDVNSEEFINELEITKNFTQKVCEQFGFVYNPEEDVNESVQQGLTRNKLIYGKRFCPCFMVVGDTKEEQKKADNRVCPCKPALEVEIPNDGKCRCGIFCTPEFAQKAQTQNELEEAAHTHSRGLSKQECEVLLQKQNLDSSELEALLEAREEKTIEFNLVDVREWMEWVSARIKGCDYLVPTTSFYNAIAQLETQKDVPSVVYCHIGSRSAYCQRIMQDLGFKSVSNLEHGIVSYQGEMLSGEED
ncbi:ferredoxin-thioredoxin reductase catalytic domain-containing protein [Candidatus Marinarcus aquaticus]|uniref:Sulfurtransferase n=1 Tax=Candidatus Marinarcus aquaticus TaxID=2044504 RepID=A0A4Q0XNW7_9BACT|nr:ferredoxin-thioredoxin reductase catalytic domain-containing protein [Candidatus Marinarcus aquaticus]RXJ56284.1 sulfurtransferase [Candidatus Marinarcus aquaticus]